MITPTERDARPSLYPRMCWNHFRDPEDTTLRLTSLLLHNDFFMILYSRLNHLALAFYCSPMLESDIASVSIADPSILEIPSTDIESRLSPNIAQISSLSFREIAHLPVSASKDHYNPSARLIKLFTVDSRLSVHESILSVHENDSHVGEQETGKDVLRLRRRHAGGQKDQSARFQNNFIVDDWDESVLGTGTLLVAGTGISNITPLAIPQWTLDCRQVYAVVIGETLAARIEDGAEQPPKQGLHESIENLRNKISVMSRKQSVGQTALEVLGSSPSLDDIDQNAQEIDGFLSTLLSDGDGLCRVVAQPSVLLGTAPRDGPVCAKSNLVDLYDRLANDWLASLPRKIPGRTRIMKEKAIREVAADLALTQITVLRQVTGDPAKPNNENGANDGDGLRESITNDDFDDTVGNQLPQSTDASRNARLEATGNSATTRNSSTKMDEGVLGIKDSGIPLHSCLPTFTKFNSKRSMPQHIATMLQHWQPGVDPDEYDWSRTSQLQEGDALRQSTPTTPKRRLRRKPSHTTRADSSVPPVSSDSPVTRDWGSQPDDEPDRSAIRYQPSSQIVNEELPMTQIERGAFGGREATGKNVVKARKKRRAAGF
ncbi:hypothetical protein FE257_010151 [Aspergillus nanangensis]|uniref:Uncharacterized protein n=1 Tax=Aspergillus nanangensis TaxID=2582783 RepID=A0AAD4CJ02_ASPNN|nr:hypothetical protein FE257_010151 [Aspergillus nanangensis]